jgi:hypothetical protein
VDETARYGTEADHLDQEHNLAKVRVAGSNPFFRSIWGVHEYSEYLVAAELPSKS